jgi:hypothetical protein
MSLSN